MNTLENQIRHLEKIIASKPSGYVADVEVCLVGIATSQQPWTIERLFQILDESAPDELMFSILHTVEQWDDETYCKALLRSVEKLWQRAPRWAEVVHIRIMNSQQTVDTYLDLLEKTSDSTRSVVKNIYEAIATKWPNAKTKALSVIDQLEGSRKQ